MCVCVCVYIIPVLIYLSILLSIHEISNKKIKNFFVVSLPKIYLVTL